MVQHLTKLKLIEKIVSATARIIKEDARESSSDVGTFDDHQINCIGLSPLLVQSQSFSQKENKL